MGESITEGTIIDWKKKVGDKVEKDETILEISTDKVDSEVPSPSEGVLIEISANKNDTVDVGSVIGYIGESNEEAPSIKENLEDSDNDTKEEIENPKLKQNKSISNMDPLESQNTKLGKDKFYSPLVRSIAKREDIDVSELDSIKGTGRGGRINKSDILDYISRRSSSKKLDKIISKKSQSIDEIEEMDVVRKRISEHMIHSQEVSAHVYSTVEIDMSNLLEVKKKYADIYNQKHSIKLTVTSLVIDACIKALHEFPLLNASIDNTNIIHHKNINMGVAVALEDNNLIVPVIKSSEELNLIGICRSLEELSIKARSKQLSLDQVQGSTFTITNPGVFGGLMGIPIINQPNVGILSIGKIQKKPVVKETEFGDSIFIRSMMYATLGYDHRLIDGAYGTKFLSLLSETIESYNAEIEK
jgi:2-oxoglutarate dehydrogenase E2 component (dihydrolipoamide succinyltransferase)